MNLLPGKIVETGNITTVALDGGGTARSAVPTQAADKGLLVNVGVRPEDLVTVDSDPLFTGTVKFSEALGEVTLLYFNAIEGAASVIAKLPGIHNDTRGQTLHFNADPKKVQIFHNSQSLYYR